jgi:hypothetical protein
MWDELRELLLLNSKSEGSVAPTASQYIVPQHITTEKHTTTPQLVTDVRPAVVVDQTRATPQVLWQGVDRLRLPKIITADSEAGHDLGIRAPGVEGVVLAAADTTTGGAVWSCLARSGDGWTLIGTFTSLFVDELGVCFGVH